MTPAAADATLLLVEDDDATRTFLADNLAADGYELLVAASAREGRRALDEGAPDLAILDVSLPDGSGLDLVRAVRDADGIGSRIDPRLPLLCVSGRAGDVDRVRAFERGCDDFVAKPFSYPELRWRIAALLRRSQDRAARGRLRVGPIVIDPSSRGVRLNGRTVEVSAKEYALLRVLAGEPRRVFTKEELLRTVWGYRDGVGRTRTLDSHVCRLRRKLGADGDRFLVNVWGIGYRLVEDA